MTQLMNKSTRMSIGKFIRALFKKDTPISIKLIVGLALTYTFVPIDLLPDFLGIAGLMDDTVVIALLTSFAMKLLDHHQEKMRMHSTANVQ